MVRLNRSYRFFFGLIQLIVYGLQTKRLKRQLQKMDEIAKKPKTADMRASIGGGHACRHPLWTLFAVSMAVSVESVKTERFKYPRTSRISRNW